MTSCHKFNLSAKLVVVMWVPYMVVLPMNFLVLMDSFLMLSLRPSPIWHTFYSSALSIFKFILFHELCLPTFLPMRSLSGA